MKEPFLVSACGLGGYLRHMMVKLMITGYSTSNSFNEAYPFCTSYGENHLDT
jgi:hypothetical protein